MNKASARIASSLSVAKKNKDPSKLVKWKAVQCQGASKLYHKAKVAAANAYGYYNSKCGGAYILWKKRKRCRAGLKMRRNRYFVRRYCDKQWPHMLKVDADVKRLKQKMHKLKRDMTSLCTMHMSKSTCPVGEGVIAIVNAKSRAASAAAAGVKNFMKRCWRPCLRRQGTRCANNYCGKGLCCRKKWKGGGCDGKIGGRGHRCVMSTAAEKKVKQIRAASPVLCGKCPAGMYSDTVDRSPCKLKTYCRRGQGGKPETDNTKNHKCGHCPKGTWSKGTRGACKPFTPCQPGYGLSTRPRNTRDIKCGQLKALCLQMLDAICRQ